MIIKRYENNPILEPDKKKHWQMQAVFNACPVEKNKHIYLVYRAISANYYHNYTKQKMNLSTIGIAKSKDGINFTDQKKFIFPQNQWERFGCEDPKITKFRNKYYIFYTALSQYPFRASGIKVAVAISRDLETIEEKHLVTPFNAKAMALFPDKINNKIWCIFSFNTDSPPTKICLAKFNNEKEIWSYEYWSKWYKNHEKYMLNLKRRQGYPVEVGNEGCLNQKDHVEVGAPPIKTKYGWLLIYSYIKNYFSSNPVFGIEAILLDLKNPLKIIARTLGPILIADEYYEKIGLVPNIIFPSGAIIKNKQIYLYYGSADTTCSLAFIDSSSLFSQMLQKNKLKNLSFKRSNKNPIISPNQKNNWESKATFNPGAIYLEGKVHLIYRAVSQDNISTLGYATSKDGINIDYRSSKPIYVPRDDFEKSGCEDPRLTIIDNRIYMFYTAYNSKTHPRVALTFIDKKDFLENKWNWSKPLLISPPNTDDKDACIFPEKINNLFYIFHRIGNGIDLSSYSKLNFNENNFLEENLWMEPRKGWWDCKKIGVATPPIKTKNGWLVLYHGILEDNSYSVGAFLLDLKDPFKIISKTDNPIFGPKTEYEKNGLISNVVFPCGAVLIKEKLYIYYGAADKVIGVATIKLEDLLEKLKVCSIVPYPKLH
ncbi:MAG: hypothetical protein B6U87_00930 [Candidatus Aenigmarchaeota archaeon ex4484_52]|nr:MAG: hypothetical protein B6U87_00930 [Candidatus Aenigmarchaeota archaeon ex4484_52]